jgi:cellulose biosynthesis protein BcsQ
VQDRVRGRIEMLLRKFEGAFDIVILDCAPGLSAASAAALKMASKIIVPFRPDYVSQFAVDRIASLIEGRNGPASLSQVPLNSRRYACLANFVRDNGRDRIVIETIAYDHPILNTMLPQSPALADAFDFIGEKMTMNEKYGADVAAIRKLYDEVRQRFGL